MTEEEARKRIEAWLTAHSPFMAKVVSLIAEEQGGWKALVNCEGMQWQQTVSPKGEVSAPVILD
jgi:hypothetical protein